MKEVKVIDNNNVEIIKGGHREAVKILKQAFINDHNKRLRGV